MAVFCTNAHTPLVVTTEKRRKRSIVVVSLLDLYDCDEHLIASPVNEKEKDPAVLLTNPSLVMLLIDKVLPVLYQRGIPMSMMRTLAPSSSTLTSISMSTSTLTSTSTSTFNHKKDSPVIGRAPATAPRTANETSFSFLLLIC